VPILWSQVEPVIHKKQGWLIAVATASLGLYLCLAVRYPLSPSLAYPRASWASLIDPTGLNASQHLAIYLGLALLYLAALRLLVPTHAKNEAPPRRLTLLIFAAWLAGSGVLLCVAPAGESHDIFDYLFRGRMMTEYQANPLVDVPESFGLAVPYARYLAWRKNVDTYGPVWEASSATVASSVRQVTSWLGWWDESYPVCPQSPESCRLLMAYITGYRLLAISLTGFSGCLIASIIRRRQAGFVPLALAAWLWNPLTLITTAVGGHNDALMLLLVLLGWWLLQRQRPFWAVMALILAAHVKLTAFIWLPVCVLWIAWRYGWGRAMKIGLASAASGLALSWLLYIPFGGWQSLSRMLAERSAYLANSLWLILKYLLTELWGLSPGIAHQLSTNLPNWLFGAGALLIPLWLFNFRPNRWRSTPIPPQETDQILWRALAVISLLYLLVGSFWFQHWYVLWFLAPAVLLPNSHLVRSVFPWLAFGALSSNVVMGFFLTAMLKTTPLITIYILSVAIIWGPALIAIAIRALIKKWSRHDSPTEA
jgi:hypothetical protein